MAYFQKIVPFLWFNNKAEEAVQFYISLFQNSRVKSESRYGKAGPGPEGSIMIMTFELEGQEFIALNGGPAQSFTPAVSLFVNCDTQDEVDHLWQQLGDGGKELGCGWITDKFGLSWQIVPTIFGELMSDKDAEKRSRVMKAMLQMYKLDGNVLKQAYDGTL